MNKKKFIETLSKQLSYPEDTCLIINEILEHNFFLSTKNKDKIILELIQKMNINREEAERIYENSLQLIKKEMKYSLKHPFQNKD